ncbi:uncharacterized protein LOC122791844 isoform X2 [Protopterus annectens]|uniref:uncharacterized protein LOC122791844 isoform X2 n=1 Tax=Protopterus annectens TaxID=7888 RepID=UPI001CF9E00F|nr:uncharacterized protein LOC122791844 isoform X2 [Protopterus annectens]XP_043915744.1 uncharacterized protein LOC122791844 isoform X2 [Protopterus annectens]
MDKNIIQGHYYKRGVVLYLIMSFLTTKCTCQNGNCFNPISTNFDSDIRHLNDSLFIDYIFPIFVYSNQESSGNTNCCHSLQAIESIENSLKESLKFAGEDIKNRVKNVTNAIKHITNYSKKLESYECKHVSWNASYLIETLNNSVNEAGTCFKQDCICLKCTIYICKGKGEISTTVQNNKEGSTHGEISSTTHNNKEAISHGEISSTTHNNKEASTHGEISSTTHNNKEASTHGEISSTTHNNKEASTHETPLSSTFPVERSKQSDKANSERNSGSMPTSIIDSSGTTLVKIISGITVASIVIVSIIIIIIFYRFCMKKEARQ